MVSTACSSTVFALSFTFPVIVFILTCLCVVPREFLRNKFTKCAELCMNYVFLVILTNFKDLFLLNYTDF